MKSYASFCPVAKTSEFFAERWTPLLLREFCLGATRFSEFQQGIPMISKALLAQRLRELEDVGIIEKGPSEQRAGSAYRLTQAGEALRPLIDMMADWGQAHGRHRVELSDTDPEQLMWAIRRHLNPERIPAERLVVQFEFTGLAKGSRISRYWWMVLEPAGIDVCQKNPGYEVDVTVAADLQTFTHVWLGSRGLKEAHQKGGVRISGPAKTVAKMRQAFELRDRPWQRPFDFSPRRDPFQPL